MKFILVDPQNTKNFRRIRLRRVKVEKSFSSVDRNEDTSLDDYLIMSQSTLENIWLTPEEDEAWKNL